ncbi:MAG: TlpA family protein disulfide reductase [Woeseiaceae bacterium]
MRAAVFGLFVILVVIAGCGAGTDDHQVAPPPPGTFVDGSGNAVSLSDFSGRYVWIDYAAEWCAACTPQSMAIKSVARTASEKLAFITIMVSERGGYGHPSTVVTAARWASQLGLDPSHVWAGQVRHRFLPRNLLYSPQGDVLFDQVGELNAGQIQAEIARHVGK